MLQKNFWERVILGREDMNIANPSYSFVSVPTVRIDGGDPEMYVESGSSVVLRCHISDWLQKPQIVFWYVLKNSYM